MFALVLQTTAREADDTTLEAVTLLLVVAFVVSMSLLAVLVARKRPDAGEQKEAARPPQPPPDLVLPERRLHPKATTSTPPAPAWLSGVTWPSAPEGLSAAIEVVEHLLQTRRDGNLAAGLNLYSPAGRERLLTLLGIPAADADRQLSDASVTGEVPVIRSAELIESGIEEITVRVTYADRTAETYRLVAIDGRWCIDSIDRA